MLLIPKFKPKLLFQNFSDCEESLPSNKMILNTAYQDHSSTLWLEGMGVGQQNNLEKQGTDGRRVEGDMGKKNPEFIFLQILVFTALQAGATSAVSSTTNRFSSLSHQQFSLVMLRIGRWRCMSFTSNPEGPWPSKAGVTRGSGQKPFCVSCPWLIFGLCHFVFV